MTNQSHARFAVAFILLATASWLAAAHGDDSVASIAHRSALIAHVSVAGEIQFGNNRAQVVEILDSSRGPEAGQLTMVSGEPPLKWDFGDQFLLFAERDESGLYRPLPETFRATDSEKLRDLVPPQSPATIAGAVTHLRNECRQRDVRLTVKLNQRDVRNYEPDAPLRVEITIDNIGGEDFNLQNRIEYECRHSRFVEHERQLKQLRDKSSSPPVKICLQQLGLRRAFQDIARMEHQLAEHYAIAPGQQARGTYDLAEQYDIQGGGRFHVWAEVGPHRSSPVLLELPEAEEALEVMEAELAFDDGGPFRIVKQTSPDSHSMPDVSATLAGDAIDAVLAFWFHETDRGSEIVILRSPNLPDEFAPDVPGVQFIISDVQWRNDGEATTLKTSQGETTFRWRTLRIESVEVQGDSATVEVIQNDRHNLGGSGATIRLQRENGQWQIAGEVELWQR